MEKLYPLTFRPNIHTALWGRESWEISGHPSSPSVVAEGPLAGRTLEELAEEYGSALTGAKAHDPTRFPLLCASRKMATDAASTAIPIIRILFCTDSH